MKKVRFKKWSARIKFATAYGLFEFMASLAGIRSVYLSPTSGRDQRGVDVPINLLERLPGVDMSADGHSVECYRFKGNDHCIVEYRGQYDFIRKVGWFQRRFVKD